MNNDDETDGNRYNSLIQHSRYYDTENLRKTLHENINSFTILSTNIETFNSKFDELTIFIKLCVNLNSSSALYLYKNVG